MKKTHYIFFVLGISMLTTSCLKEYDNPAEGKLNENADLYVIRGAYRGSTITLNEEKVNGARQTRGVVISDKTGGNIEPGTFIIQHTSETSNQAGDLTSGLLIEMTDNANVPALGDSVIVNVLGGTLGRKGGSLVLSGISPDKVTVVANNRTPFVRPVTLKMFNGNPEAYESTLVSVHADVADYGSGVSFNGERLLDDHTGSALLLTKSTAVFAGNAVPVNAQFTGIAGYENTTGNDTAGAKKVIHLRNASDVAYVSGALYPGFPESFESPEASAKSSYNITATQNNIDLSTGNWKLQQAILGNTLLSDKINLPGAQNIRMQQNLSSSALLQMNFDVTQGISKVTFFYGRYGTDPSSTFRLEYSTNGGTSWTVVSPNISSMPEKGSAQAVFMLNLSGIARIRINKLGLGASSPTVNNGRLSIDDLAIYRN